MDFTARYRNLNAHQRQAVDTIDGPVMVIAGPGTGKTELLGMRAANILKKTDTLPGSILCLTFTESGAHAMRERLASIIGKDAYKVAIHTFHSFGTEVINQHGDYFYHGAQFQPADDLATFEIIRGILDGLDYTNPLTGKMNGEYTHLRDIISTISDLKRSGLTSDELLHIVDTNEAALDAVEPDLANIFQHRIGATTLAQLTPVAHQVAELEAPILPSGVTPLTNTLALSLAHAVDAATESDSTKPITAWKNKWMTKNSAGNLVFKDRARHDKLRAVAAVYFQYLSRMQEAELYDYDDMILRVVHAMEIFDDLRFNLQEKYQYIMVDEFQDTNLAQMRILANLTNNPAHGDTPNVMVVGDDDQAIYSFQGADVSNILSFRDLYPKASLIPLIDNYRSGEPVLEVARSIITQGEDRLENHIDHLNKTLTAHTDNAASVSLYEAPTVADEHHWLVSEIAAQIEKGTAPNNIAVLARRHREIVELLPHFAKKGIAVNYERRDNVFELDPIILITSLSRVIVLLGDQQIDEADRLLPELLAHPAWGITSQDLWQLSIKAYDGRTRWLDTMAVLPTFQPLHQWITQAVISSHSTPLEQMLDILMGNPEDQSDNAETYRSPLYRHYFSGSNLTNDPSLYLRYLEGLRTIREALRSHAADTTPTLATFINFIDLHQESGSILTSVHQPAATSEGAVNLMTAHKSKGLEFDTVYIIGAVESMWGERVRSRSRLIGYPENLPLGAVGDSPDERLRLFYVAATRAKRRLIMSYAAMDNNGKLLERAGFLLGLEASSIPQSHLASPEEIAAQRWYSHLTEPTSDLRTLLAPALERYKLSATHLGNFLDVTRGGPQGFLIHNLLRFPQAMSPSAAYGSAVHAALQRAHSHLSATGKPRAIEDILHDYETELTAHRLSADDYELYSQKGSDALTAFLGAKYDDFTTTQKVELNFAGQQSMIDTAHLTGKLDLVDINTTDKTMVVTDYKTGHPARTWKGSSDYEKIKLHRYRQQLMFYKLLIEHSRDYSNYTVTRGVLQFVEPDKSGEILALEDDFSNAELDEFRRLLCAVWQKITTLDLPNTDDYESSYKGILAFERDLLDGNV